MKIKTAAHQIINSNTPKDVNLRKIIKYCLKFCGSIPPYHPSSARNCCYEKRFETSPRSKRCGLFVVFKLNSNWMMNPADWCCCVWCCTVSLATKTRARRWAEFLDSARSDCILLRIQLTFFVWRQQKLRRKWHLKKKKIILSLKVMWKRNQDLKCMWFQKPNILSHL